jgi:hypothetical protein
MHRFELLTNKYFEDHVSPEDELEDWKSGSSFRLPGIKAGREFERNHLLAKIRVELDNVGTILLVGALFSYLRNALLSLIS